MSNSAYYYRISRQNVHAVGTKNGVNRTFSLPNGETYLPVSLVVSLNGQILNDVAISKNIGYSTFTVNDNNITINAEDVLTVSYLVETL
jgi:hypothetical protein